MLQGKNNKATENAAMLKTRTLPSGIFGEGIGLITLPENDDGSSLL